MVDTDTPTDFETIRFEVRDHVAIVTLDRPESMNAYDDRMQGELATAWRSIRADTAAIWAVVVTGAGDRAFCAGRDVKELSEYQQAGRLVPRYDPASPTFGERGAHLHKFGVPQPVVGAINGLAVGGGLGLFLSCDIRIMSETAWIADGHANVGQVGGVTRIADHLPHAIASELILAGGRLDARRAYELGLVNRVTAPDRVLDEALAVADQICRLSPLAVRRSKEIMTMRMQHDASLERLEDNAATTMRETHDGREGPLARREHREPVWTGR